MLVYPSTVAVTSSLRWINEKLSYKKTPPRMTSAVPTRKSVRINIEDALAIKNFDGDFTYPFFGAGGSYFEGHWVRSLDA